MDTSCSPHPAPLQAGEGIGAETASQHTDVHPPLRGVRQIIAGVETVWGRRSAVPLQVSALVMGGAARQWRPPSSVARG